MCVRIARLGKHRSSTHMPYRRAPQNETFRTFLSECVQMSCRCLAELLTLAPRLTAHRPLDGLQRWQMFMILITLIISQLLVNIWMFYAKVRAACACVIALSIC